MEKRGNSEVEIKKVGSTTMMILPGSDQELPYDGRFDNAGMVKTAMINALTEGKSVFIES